MNCPKCDAEMARSYLDVTPPYHSNETGAIEQDVKQVWHCDACGLTVKNDEIPY